MAALHEPSVVKVVMQSAGGSRFPTLWEAHSNSMKDQTTDPTKMLIAPYVRRPILKENDKILIRLKAISADTIVLTSSVVRIPVTKFDTRTKTVYEDFLSGSDFAEVDGGTDGIAFAAGQEADFASYTVPNGIELVLGHKLAQNSRICVVPYDDTA